MSWVVLTSAQSKERLTPAGCKDRLRHDATASSWEQPKARAGCRDCGSDGDRCGRAPCSPRTSDDDAPAWTHATDNFRTVGSPIDSRARTEVSFASSVVSRQLLGACSRQRGFIRPPRPFPLQGGERSALASGWRDAVPVQVGGRWHFSDALGPERRYATRRQGADALRAPHGTARVGSVLGQGTDVPRSPHFRRRGGVLH
jgi:hypothetical protein